MNFKFSRIILAGLAANLASFLIGGGGYLIFGEVFSLEPISVWRWRPETMFEMSFGWWVYLIVGNTLAAIGIAFVFAVLYRGIPGRGIKRGAIFGMLVWLIGVLPASFTVHVMTIINGWTVLYMTLQGLLEHTIYGATVAAVLGKPNCPDTTM